jgi:hypothetical protein
MSLRIGYVNVRGLSPDKFETCCRLVDTIYDFFFVAETWFVDHHLRKRDRRFIASTCKTKQIRGRPTGGIYLLGTKHARSVLTAKPMVTTYSITFQTSKLCVSGVYFPPASMSIRDVEGHLKSLYDSSIIIGDVNVRFRNSFFQEGTAGPTDRLDVFTQWLNTSGRNQVLPLTDSCTDIKPIISHCSGLRPKLNLDHCFISQRLLTRVSLRLLDTAQIPLRTDHRYVMHLTVAAQGERVGSCIDPIRYRLHRLREKKSIDQIPLVLKETIQNVHYPTIDVDELNTMLTTICQTVAAKICGLYKPSVKMQSADKSIPHLHQESTTHSSTRLFKEAMRGSNDNGPILPTSSSIDAMTENLNILKTKYSALVGVESLDHSRPEIYRDNKQGYGNPSQILASPDPKGLEICSEFLPQAPISPDPRGLEIQPSDLAPDQQICDESWVAFFHSDKIKSEIISQAGEKSCGHDGIHIQLLKAFIDTEFIPLLESLFVLCARTGQTPKAWNRSTIHLLSKDVGKRRDANNLRPITIICMFRKIFERLLLQTFDESGWARVHPAQAGFRGGYSVITNAAVVHHMLSTRLRTTAVFLDLQAAFDMVSHQQLDKILAKRGCPISIRRLISALMFKDVWSQVIVNDAVSPPFQRTRGILQGSPQSPPLFNIFIDGLLYILNAGAAGLPNCLFYADDGVILTKTLLEAQRLLGLAEEWVEKVELNFNVKKCAVISSAPAVLTLQGQIIPMANTYKYLGFPVTSHGIDFPAHLASRIGAAVRWCDFLTIKSGSWGVANRLHVYNQHLAPMFEFGAPLVESWRQGSRDNQQAFLVAFKPWKKLIAWIGGSESCVNVTANLLGLTSPQKRFQRLKTQYQLVLEGLAIGNPLRVILDTVNKSHLTFACVLKQDKTFSKFINTISPGPDLEPQLWDFLRMARREAITKEAQNAKLTRIIPIESRKVPGLFLADISLAAPVHAQRMLLSYRRNRFGARKNCPCGKPFRRTHEICSHLPHPIQLSKAERVDKAAMFSCLQLDDFKITDIDYLLNKGRLKEATDILAAISTKLDEAYHQEQLLLAESNV